MRIAMLVLPGMRSFDVVAAMEVLADDRQDRGVPRNDVVVCSPAERVVLEHGLSLRADARTEGLVGADLVVVPGFQDVATLVRGGWAAAGLSESVDALRAASASGSAVASLCTGAFLVAAAGLFDGARATTHWRFCALLQADHPAIRVEENVLYTHDPDRRVWSSAGVAAGIDLCLAVVAHEQGAAAAATIARSMVLPAARSGGQAQFVPPRSRDGEGFDAGLMVLTDRVRADLGRPWSLAEMASVVTVSPRTLQRTFRAALGCSPSQWLVETRVTAARELLESTPLSVVEVARRVGLSTDDGLRKHFQRRLGVSPSAYRGSFGRSGILEA
ncbi:helix-turn-helix domain-containing protein [Sanguibacter sp. 25GB23B1]|uniref:GlxA family transcriptional regulator n=1 Tax=unclassified Sanguibacter TaxID=2645534 RepID=UPI0032AF5292